MFPQARALVLQDSAAGWLLGFEPSGGRPQNSEHTGCAVEQVAQRGSQRVFLLWCTLAGLGRSSPRAGRSCFGRRDSEGERQQKQEQHTLRCGLEQHAQ